ncbi:hypothetical protein NA57DRAFT_51093 [Rhizodiscina lignyota]|uniref:Clr5 domain-containing protein n=1 Tax=Rhizodiscina lignyota TaxID=1504668 RepID=A0A9P4IQJ7_9PEZI|nr:hypothetical protein NA57DRAFT_51093 [Rhizodiscina lignyota]
MQAMPTSSDDCHSSLRSRRTNSIGESFKWIDQKVRWRAKPVPDGEWEKHKDELCDRYQHTTLREVMAYMKTKYSFTASKRQYVSRFNKWNVRKYGEEGPAGSIECKSALIKDEASSKANETLTRLLEYGSLESKNTTHLGSSEAVQSKRSLPSTFSSPSACPGGKSMKIVKPTLPSAVADETRLALRLSFGDELQLPRLQRLSSADDIVEDFETWTKEQGPFSHYAVAHTLVTTCDVSHPHDSFTIADIRNMKSTADFLHATSQLAEAFVVYTMILKYLRSTKRSPDWMLTWITMACARVATEKTQLEIVQALLWDWLQDIQDRNVPMEKYIVYKLLGALYRRMGQYVGGEPFAAAAANIVSEAEASVYSFVAFLPMEHRCFDLCSYAFLVLDCEKNSAVDTSSDFESYRLEHRFKAIQGRLLYRKPGPFEIDAGLLRNPCLRSCISWCSENLHLPKTLGLFDSECWIPYGKGDLDLKTSEDLVFKLLWGHWQASKTGRTAYHPLWTTKAEKLMGISSCEVLYTVTKMIFSAKLLDTPRRDETMSGFTTHTHVPSGCIRSSNVLSHSSLHDPPFWVDGNSSRRPCFLCVDEGAAVLRRAPDEEVARMFLDIFVKAQKESGPTRLAESFQEYSDNACYHAVANEPSHLPPLERQSSSTGGHDNTDPGVLSGATRVVIAPSQHSSEQSSFRQFKAVKLNLAKKARERHVDGTLPSSVFGKDQGDDMTFLCDSVQDSLSL